MKSKTKKRLIALAGVLVLAAGGTVGLRQLRASQRAQLVTDARDRGMTAYDAGDWQQAMDSLGYYVSKGGSSDAEALFRLADARQRLPKPDGSHITDAIGLLRDAVAHAPGDTRARRLLLDMFEAAGMWPEAIQAADRLMEGQPPDRALMERRYAYLAMSGQRDQALKAALALPDTFPDDLNAHRIAVGAIARFENAAEPRLREYLAELPESLPPVDRAILEADTLGQIGDVAGALAAIEQAAAESTLSARQLGGILDLADALGRQSGEALNVADGLAARLDTTPPPPPDIAGVLIARSWRMGLDPRIATRLGAGLDDPASLPDETLGWTLVAGMGLEPAVRQALRNVLEERTSKSAEFFRDAAACADALAAHTPTDRDAGPRLTGLAQRAVQSASKLPGDMVHERALASYMQGLAESAAGDRAAGEEHLARAASHPAWRIAMRPYLSHLAARGEHRTVLSALSWDRAFLNTGTGRMLQSESLVGLAEQDASLTQVAAEAARVLEELKSLHIDRPDLDALLVRAHAASNDAPATARAVDTLLARSDAGVDLLTRTAAAIAPRGPEQAARLRDAAERLDPSHPEVLFARAIALDAQGHGAEGVGLLEAAIERADAGDRIALQIRLAMLLDRMDQPETRQAIDVLRELHSASDSLPAQRAVLYSGAAWRDESLVESAINRLKALAGESSAEWRLFEAQRLLTFTPSPQRASTALGDDVLKPLLRDLSSPRAYVLAAEALLVLGNRDQAIIQLERAAGALTDPTGIYPRLITLLLQAGRADNARARQNEFLASTLVSPADIRARAALSEGLAMWDQAIADRRRLFDMGAEADAVALAQLLARAGRSDQARPIFEQLADRPDAAADSIAAAAEFMAATGQAERARRLLDNLAGRMDESRRLVLLGDYLLGVETPEDALAQVRALAEAAPDADATVWLWLARTALVHNMSDQARLFVARGLQVAPDSPSLLAIQRLENSGNSTDAMLAALASLAADESASVALRDLTEAVGRFARGDDDANDLIATLEKITTNHPAEFAPWNLLSNLLLAQNQPDRAVRTAMQAMRVIPGDPRPAQMASEVLEVLGRFEEALAPARAWRDRSPANPLPAEIAMARLSLRAGRPGEAASILAPRRQAMLSNPATSLDDAIVLCWATVAAGSSEDRRTLLVRASEGGAWASAGVTAATLVADAARAGDWLEQLTSQATLSDDDAVTLAGAWIALHDRSDERDLAGRALTLLQERGWQGTPPPGASRVRAQAHERLGQDDEAAPLYAEAIAGDPADLAAHAALTELLLRRGDHSAALRAARALVVAADADDAATALQRGLARDPLARALLASGDAGSAVQEVDRGLALLPDDPSLLSRKAEALLHQGDRAAAQATLARLRPEHDPATRMLMIAERLPDPAEAQWLYQRVIDRDPNDFRALNNLAHHLLQHGGDPQKAIDLATRAVRAVRDPSWAGLGSIQETLGMAHLAADEPQEAADAFRRGIERAGEAPDLLLGLAEALSRLGRTEEARQCLERIDPSAREALPPPQKVRYERLATALDQ